jgi:membrane-associated phospholipid phosphatase
VNEPSGTRLRGTAHIGLVVGGVVLGVTGGLARRGVSGNEARILGRVNSLPEGAFPFGWLPMQYGSLGAVPTLAVAALARRRPRTALAVGACGTAAWVLAKTVKPMVGRGRPGTLLPDVRRRGSENEKGLGFPSGHAAVSAALTLAAWPYSGWRWRLASVALAGFVPVARLYVGAHLPLDVLGGSALGVFVASGMRLALDARKRSEGPEGGYQASRWSPSTRDRAGRR